MKIFLIFKIIDHAFDFLRWTRKYVKKRRRWRRIKDAIEFGKASASGDHERAIDILRRWL